MGNVTDIMEARRGRLTLTGRALLGRMELASYLSPYGPEPLSEKLRGCVFVQPASDRQELAEILGGMALEVGRRGWKRRGIGWPAGDEL